MYGQGESRGGPGLSVAAQEDTRKCVLVVDDVPENIDVVGGSLEEDYRVRVALNGRRALELASAAPPDLILLDIMMPGMDGYEVCRRLKLDVNLAGIPVIFLTSKSQVDDETRGFALGAVDFIRKPISPPVLKARVATHIALRDQAVHLESLVGERTHELHDTRLQIVERLGVAAEFKDNETGMHVVRMSLISGLVGRGAGMSDAEADTLLHAAPMHDIGKIGIPDRILLKPGKLTEDEWAVMKTHTTIGAQIIGDDEREPLRLARVVALTHHEKWNGTGYPAGLAGEDIPLAGRIVAIADVFDALTSKRPYKEPWPVDRAAETIERDAGEHFDPALVPLFLKALPDAMEIRDHYADRKAMRDVT